MGSAWSTYLYLMPLRKRSAPPQRYLNDERRILELEGMLLRADI
jgi:hypothetical protein